MLPNFLIGGASAAGTSFLFHILSQHPNIYLPGDICSEPHFFAINERYHKGLEWYNKIWFQDYKGQKAIGERSSAYFYFPNSAPRIAQHLPCVKLIFILRDPILRAWAQYRYRVFRGTEDLGFLPAILSEKERIDHEIKLGIEKRSHDYSGRSLYGLQLKHFLHHFSWNQILIINSRKLKENIHEQLKRITDFLEIEPLDQFEIISEFSTPSVKDPRIQNQARQHFGNYRDPDTVQTATWEALITAIRHNQEDLSNFVQSDEDAQHIDKVKQNICKSKESIPVDVKMHLEMLLSDDQKLFFSLAKDHIDFQSW